MFDRPTKQNRFPCSLLALAVDVDDVVQLCSLVSAQVDQDPPLPTLSPIARWQERVAALHQAQWTRWGDTLLPEPPQP